MSNAQRIAEALGGAKQHGDWWNCKCPLHDDAKNDSLGIIDREDGSVWFECLAGCDGFEIKKHVEALGLLDKRKMKNNGSAKNSRPTYTYIYTDENGEYLYEKFKFWNEKTGKKDMRCRRRQPHGEYIWNIKDIRRVLYNLPNVLRAVRDKQIIYIVEGEKDADTLNKLGLVATTSITTSQWPHEFSKLLAGTRVVIIPDNDVAGEKGIKVRAASLSKEVAELKVLNLPLEIKDVTEWFELGKTLEDFKLLIEETELIQDKATKKKEAEYADYIEIIQEYLGDLRRDIFSGDLCYFDKQIGFWCPVLNEISALKSWAIQKSKEGRKVFRPAEVELHLAYLCKSQAPRFVLDIIPDNSIDIIKIIADRVTLKHDPANPGVNSKCFEELLKYWHTKMWARLFDRTVRNEIFILSGPQNIGKDFWIRENCGALGQYLVNFAIHNNENDTKAQLHQGLVMNISEFDRTSKTEVSLLKEIVTTIQTNLRFSYDKRAQPRNCHCSFIASTNINDIFNDSTGHTRYVFFEVEDINKEQQFTEQEQRQVLAQGLALYLAGYKPSAESLRAMRQQIEGFTPEGESELLLDRWDHLASELIAAMPSILEQDKFLAVRDADQVFSGFIPNYLSLPIITVLVREFGKKSPRSIWSILSIAGRKRVDPALGRGYYFKQRFREAVIENSYNF